MTDLGKGRSGPKESDNRDKSLHGLMVALAMAGAIAGSAILFAYASSDSPAPDGTASTTNEVELQPEPKPVIAEKVADEPVYAEKIEYVDSTDEAEKPVYVNTTTEAEEQVPVPAYTEVKIEESMYVSEAEDEPVSLTETQSGEQKEKDDDRSDEPELQDISNRVTDLLQVVDADDDEKEEKDDDGDDDDDDENKGKGHKHDKHDDD